MNQKFLAPKFTPLRCRRVSPDEQKQAAERFYQLLNLRRTVRDFSNEPVPFELIETAIKTASTAPSGANM